jgi:hypothetical protein
MPELADIFDAPVYGLSTAAKSRILMDMLLQMTGAHYEHCDAYRAVVDGLWEGGKTGRWSELADLPYIHVRMFKHYLLKSVADDQVIKTITSSGTTGAAVSRISLDDLTSRLQTRALVYIMQQFLGKQRLPMLIIDHPSVVKDRRNFSARGAGILGLSNFGRDHTYALNDDMSINHSSIEGFLERHWGQPILLFGFTFMVWQYFVTKLQASGATHDLSKGVLFHSGGWKKLQDEAVSNADFKQRVQDVTGIARVHNFYGMAEQVGSVFMECEAGYLHTPVFAELIVRDPTTFRPLPFGTEGIIQVLSCLPGSYPGHSILTEDIGVINGEDSCPCGRLGRYFSVIGRLPKAEARGCSDTHQVI